MNYQQFVSAVEKNLKQTMKGGVKVSCYTAVKNNGTERTGVVIETPGINISPTIYLEEYYEQYRKGRTMEETMNALIEFYQSIRREEPWDCSTFLDYKGVKDRIVFKLINTEKNKGFLEDAPHRTFLDLSVTFYVLVEISCDGTAAMPVKYSHIKRWGVEEKSLWETALQNVKRLLPAEFFTMRHALKECVEHKLLPAGEENLLCDPDSRRDSMYVLSNKIRSYGAACIAYPYVLEMIGDILSEDFYVLPSSVHEVVIVPASAGIPWREMDEMVQEINRTQVAPEEVLSDSAYLFERASGTLRSGCGQRREACV